MDRFIEFFHNQLFVCINFLLNIVNWFMVTWQGIANAFHTNFIVENRYEFVLDGVFNTLALSLLAGILGILLGALVTFCKLSKITPLRWFANVYLDIIRGTPAVTQLLVIYFVILGGVKINIVIAGSIAFGINSGAYVAEIIRAGILSIDKGQTEAGRSLGLTQRQTMMHIVFPQAIKNILPALANEFILLIKETSIAGYIGIMELTKGVLAIQSRTFNSTIPLLTSAVIYYAIIKTLTVLLGKLEKNMRKADAR